MDAVDRASSRDTSIISCWTETLTVPFSNVERSVKRSRERDRRLKLEDRNISENENRMRRRRRRKRYNWIRDFVQSD